MFPEKLQELEEKIRLTAEMLAQLRREKQQLVEEHQEAEKRIVALEREIARLHADSHTPGVAAQQPSPPSHEPPEQSQDQALHDLSDTLFKEPTNLKALFELGNAYERQGMYEHAIEEYRKVLQIDANFIDAIEHLAFLLEKLNRDHEASPLWERILSLKRHA